MKIGILGSGTMGTALASRMRRAGHDVVIGSRQPDPSGGSTGYADAVARSDVIFLALSWPHGIACVRGLPSFDNRILVDVSNPESEDGRSLVVGHSESGAERIGANANGARMVKAFSHFYAELLQDDVAFDGGTPSVLFCGDDLDAKIVVGQLIAGCGFDPVDAGALVNARYLEPLAMLTVQLVRNQGWGPTGVAWRLMRKTLVEH